MVHDYFCSFVDSFSIRCSRNMANIFLSLYKRILVRHPVRLLPETKVNTAAVGATQADAFGLQKKAQLYDRRSLLATGAVLTFVLGVTFVCGTAVLYFIFS